MKKTTFFDNKSLGQLTCDEGFFFQEHPKSQTTDTQRRHKSEKSEIFGQCGRQNMLWPYLKIWHWDQKLMISLGVKNYLMD